MWPGLGNAPKEDGVVAVGIGRPQWGFVATHTLSSRATKAIEIFWIRAEIRAEVPDGPDQSRLLCALVCGDLSALLRKLSRDSLSNDLGFARSISLGRVL